MWKHGHIICRARRGDAVNSSWKETLATVSSLKAKADLFLPPSVHTKEKAESPAPLPLAGPAVGIAIHRWEALQ